MNPQNLNFVEVPSSGKHNNFFSNGTIFVMIEQTQNLGKNTTGVQEVTAR